MSAFHGEHIRRRSTPVSGVAQLVGGRGRGVRWLVEGQASTGAQCVRIANLGRDVGGMHCRVVVVPVRNGRRVGRHRRGDLVLTGSLSPKASVFVSSAWVPPATGCRRLYGSAIGTGAWTSPSCRSAAARCRCGGAVGALLYDFRAGRACRGRPGDRNLAGHCGFAAGCGDRHRCGPARQRPNHPAELTANRQRCPASASGPAASVR
jgi:hypothetical protein